jgi:glycosyltransferase involved in cell wall biosynthesis
LPADDLSHARLAVVMQVPDFYFSPLKLYEYMAEGLAVVASDAGEIAGLVRHGQTGLLCPPGDAGALAAALLRLARDPVSRVRRGAAARAQAERHTWARNATVVTDLARELAMTRPTGRASGRMHMEKTI